jgi:hypothetical protein
LPFYKKYNSDETKKDEMSGKCRTHMKEARRFTSKRYRKERTSNERISLEIVDMITTESSGRLL